VPKKTALSNQAHGSTLSPDSNSPASRASKGDCQAILFHGLAPGHHSTGEWSRLSDLTINEAASLKSLTVAPDQ